MNHVPVGSGIRALHVRTGVPALCARVTSWLGDHSVQHVACDDAFQAVAYLLRHPENMPDIVLVGLDWLADDDFSLFAFLHDTWPSAAVVTYVNESLRRTPAPHPSTIDCQSPTELASVLANSPAAILGAAQSARLTEGETPRVEASASQPEPPDMREPPRLASVPELPPLRAGAAANPADNSRGVRRTPLRSVSRPADLLTPDELAALLKKDFR